MSRKKLPITVYVTAEQRDQLRALHEATRVPTAVVIREGIDTAIAQRLLGLRLEDVWRAE